MQKEEKNELIAEEKNEIIATLFGLYPDYNRHFNIFLNMKNFELTKSQVRALLILARTSTLSMGELAEKMDISREQATRVVNSLAEKTLIERCIHPGNRRRIDISLSENGVDYLESLKKNYQSTMNQALDKLTHEERQDFLTALHLVMKTLDRIL